MSVFNTPEIISKFDKGEPAFISFHFHNERIMKSIESVLVKILSRFDLTYLLDPVITVLREIITNAVKANAKRYFFKKLNLDINDPESYTKGLKKFKIDMMEKFTEIEDELNRSGYIADLFIKKTGGGMMLTIKNNAPIHPTELERINIRLEKAKEYQDFTDAYDDIYDDSEGAGLGLVLTILLLKNTGIGEDSFEIESNEYSTQVHLSIPFDLKPREITTEIKKQIISEIRGLPTFHEHILTLQRLCKDPGATIDSLVKKIIIDPALSTDILKLANSAYFAGMRKIGNLNEAVVRIGLKNLNGILIATGARRILEERYPIFSEIWAHSNKVAAYARDIATRYNMIRVKDNAFLGGLLHDLGKIVLLATDKKFTAWIAELMKNRSIRTSTVLEEITLGISHSSIGELMAQRWSFPGALLEAIKYHHAPLSANEKHRDLVFVVYLANMLCGLEIKKYHFYYIENEVMKRFNITSESMLHNLHNYLKAQQKRVTRG